MEENYKYFSTIVQEKNLTKAAQKLYISQPALSKYLQRLEQELGQQLFIRTPKTLRLTAAGELYYEYLQNEQMLTQRFYQELNALSGQDSGLIKLGITSYRGSVFMPAVMPHFQAHYPHIQLDLTDGTSSYLLDELLKERLQFCITDSPEAYYKTLLFQEEFIAHEKILIAVSKSYPGINRYISDPEHVLLMNNNQIFPHIPIGRIAKETFLMTKTYQSMSFAIEQTLLQSNIHLNKVFRCYNLYTCINMMTSGLGFCFIPKLTLHFKNIPNDVLFLTAEDVDLTWSHNVYTKKGISLDHNCRLFIDMLKSILEQYE